jgi:hypothetical protein
LFSPIFTGSSPIVILTALIAKLKTRETKITLPLAVICYQKLFVLPFFNTLVLKKNINRGIGLGRIQKVQVVL